MSLDNLRAVMKIEHFLLVELTRRHVFSCATIQRHQSIGYNQANKIALELVEKGLAIRYEYQFKMMAPFKVARSNYLIF